MIEIEIIGIMAGILTTGAQIPQALQIHKTHQTRDINFLWLTSLWIGTALWLFYGWTITSLPLIIFNGISMFLVSYMWVEKYDGLPIRTTAAK